MGSSGSPVLVFLIMKLMEMTQARLLILLCDFSNTDDEDFNDALMMVVTLMVVTLGINLLV